MNSDPSVMHKRCGIDAIDADIIALIQRRREISAAIRNACLTAQQPQSDHAHEMNIYQRYGSALGKPGIRIAGAIESSCR